MLWYCVGKICVLCFVKCFVLTRIVCSIFFQHLAADLDTDASGSVTLEEFKHFMLPILVKEESVSDPQEEAERMFDIIDCMDEEEGGDQIDQEEGGGESENPQVGGKITGGSIFAGIIGSITYRPSI